MSSTVLRAQDLAFAYPQRRLFQGLSFELPAGLSLLRGGDGSGKTTLLRLLAGDLPSDAGTLCLRGSRLDDQPLAYRAQVFRVDHQASVQDTLTAAAHVAALSARYPGFDAARLPALIEGLGLTPHWQKPLYMLSTGSRRKVWLAGAFACGAPLTLLDEPFAALDQPSIRFVLSLLQAAATDPLRAWVLADYEAPPALPLAMTLDLPD